MLRRRFLVPSSADRRDAPAVFSQPPQIYNDAPAAFSMKSIRAFFVARKFKLDVVSQGASKPTGKRTSEVRTVLARLRDASEMTPQHAERGGICDFLQVTIFGLKTCPKDSGTQK